MRKVYYIMMGSLLVIWLFCYAKAEEYKPIAKRRCYPKTEYRMQTETVLAAKILAAAMLESAIIMKGDRLTLEGQKRYYIGITKRINDLELEFRGKRIEKKEFKCPQRTGEQR